MALSFIVVNSVQAQLGNPTSSELFRVCASESLKAAIVVNFMESRYTDAVSCTALQVLSVRDMVS